MPPSQSTVLSTPIGGVEQIIERHFEDRVHFAVSRAQRQIGRDDGNDGLDGKAGAGAEQVRAADHVHLSRRQGNLFLRLAQGSGDRVGIVRIEPPAGKGDLPAMLAQVRMALSEDHAGAGPVGDGDEHGGGR